MRIYIYLYIFRPTKNANIIDIFMFVVSNLSAIPHLISSQLGRHKQTVPGRVVEAVRDDQALFIFISS